MSPSKLERTFVYRIDAGDLVVYVTPEWEAFANENKAPELTSEAVCGQPLSSFVVNMETRHLYRVMVDSVRRDRRTIVVPFRCDGPDVRRFMELTVSPRPDEHVQLEGRIVREEYREPVRLLDSSVSRTDEFVVLCSWCKRADVTGDWVEVEEAVKLLELFNSLELPQITHGICPECLERTLRST